MADNYEKLWLQSSLNKAATTRAAEAIQAMGRALPCRVVSVQGSIVTVAFEVNAAPWALPNVTIPKAESRWIRDPIQIGDYGVTEPSDVYLGGVSGLGGGTATLAPRGNLTALVFKPIGSTAYAPVNPNAAFVSGPQGVVLQTEDGTSSVVISETGIVMTFGSRVVSLTAAGFTIDGLLFDTHQHTGGNGTSTLTGPPVP